MTDFIESFFAKPESMWQIGYFDLTARMILAVFLGGVIGLEREWSNHAAGLRTHILVCIGSASIMLLSIYGFSEFIQEENVRVDPARLAAQVISGIGFLGAGAILRNGLTISGLTTAASIWVVAAIGLSVGAGFYYSSILCTFLLFIILQVLNRWEKRMKRSRTDHELLVRVFDRPGMLGKVSITLGEQNITIKNVKMTRGGKWTHGDDDFAITQLVIQVKISDPNKLITAVDRIHGIDGVLSIDLNHNLDARPAAVVTR